MRRVLFASGIVVLLGVVVVAAQPPVDPPLTPPAPPAAPGIPSIAPPGASNTPTPPAPPKPFPGAPNGPSVAPAAPVATTEAPLSKFAHIETFPQNTQFAVRGSLMAAEWLAKMGQPHGRFLHGYLPALRQPMNGDHDLRQAQATLAMAQTAKFSGDQKHAAIASQAVLAMLASTKVDANDPNCRVPVQMSFVCNRVGFASLVVLAIVELPNPSDKLLDDAERLCAFLRTQLRTDGSVQYTDNPTDDPTKLDPAGFNEYPGLALHALAASNRVRPADWKKDAVKKGVTYYHAAFRAKPHPALVATVTPAATELYLQTKATEAATAAFEMNDWLCALQITGNDTRMPQWAGGFRSVADGRTVDAPPSAFDTGRYIHSLACAYQLTRVIGDLTHEEKYRPALSSAVQFLYGLQFLETNTRHFEDNFRAKMLMGAFHLSPTDGNLRIDATASAMAGLLRFLSCGAER
ncbi:Marine sediment metagenome DNA, contig: S01H4_L03532 (Fragment) OS=marine sediment metagenome GN=S01H4_20621 PE=4 SV=1 [Gemmata massiliana]|uniref:Marine sediment metagenome DNA, contig: S01H4_L03532 n=1 Tax=Gemmata massiliana TaxID=1210884 RepID=A0A6P2D486_9BACT